ncbi:MAG TPA: hypothetical protein VGQ36_28060 [Thermoanaerobaculia bacterium]|jgi:hypothetical protein|nr:hypothetical protein [Thermoanaerobaculia bacterium]
MSPRPLLIFIVFIAATSSAAPPRRYHLELEANPAAAFPYLSKFGTTIELHVYPSGVRAEALWLNSFSKNGASAVTIANPLGRMYVDMPVAEIAPLLQKIAGAAGSIEQNATPLRGPKMKGKVQGIDATRYRLIYGAEAWIDLWTTTAIPENPQMRHITEQLVSGISPGTASVARSLPGTPVYVEINFRRFKKVPLLKVKQLTFDVSAKEEQDALELGPVYMRAPLIDKLLD